MDNPDEFSIEEELSQINVIASKLSSLARLLNANQTYAGIPKQCSELSDHIQDPFERKKNMIRNHFLLDYGTKIRNGKKVYHSQPYKDVVQHDLNDNIKNEKLVFGYIRNIWICNISDHFPPNDLIKLIHSYYLNEFVYLLEEYEQQRIHFSRPVSMRKNRNDENKQQIAEWIPLTSFPHTYRTVVPSGIDKDNYIIIDYNMKHSIINSIDKYNINTDKWSKIDGFNNIKCTGLNMTF
eukprot:191440_1